MPIKKAIAKAILFALVLSIVLPYTFIPSAAEETTGIIPVAQITAGNSYDVLDCPPSYLVDDYGLNPAVPTDIEAATYRMTNYYCWHTAANPGDSAWLLIDLGKNRRVEDLYIWNLNQYGNPTRDIKDIEITYSSDSVSGTDGTWSSLGEFTVPQAPGNNEAQHYHLKVPFGQKARFVKIKILGSYGSEYMGLGKLIFTGDNSGSPVNLLSGATVRASSEYSAGYGAQNAIDGNSSTRWASREGTSKHWMEVTLAEPRTFNQLVVHETPAFGNRISSYRISVSDDGQTWEVWREKSCSAPTTSVVGDEVTKKHIKIEFLDCSQSGINVDEMNLFNDPDAVESPDPTGLRPVDPSWTKPTPATTPNTYQDRKEAMKYGMFIHYGINTFVNEEWTDGTIPASTYNPNLETLDPESWVKAAYEGGMNYVVLVTKHHDGFALWDTAVGTYNINNTGREGDKRDIVKEVSDACKKYGMKLGLYYSIWDRNWDNNHTTASTGLTQTELNGQYNDYALAQITELLDGRYGEIVELWIDGAWQKAPIQWEFERLYDAVKKLQPSCQMAVNWTISDEDGNQLAPADAQGGEPIRYFPSDFRLLDPAMPRPGVDGDPKIYTHQGEEYYLPFEATICLNNTWFWNTSNSANDVKSPQFIEDAYNQLMLQKNTLVINVAPNKNGVFEDYDVAGLYAGARTLGIARGSARENIPASECSVEVRHVTDTGYVAAPTEYLYGSAGAAYKSQAADIEAIGYKLVGTPLEASGQFTDQKQTITYIYHDMLTNTPAYTQQTLSHAHLGQRSIFNRGGTPCRYACPVLGQIRCTGRQNRREPEGHRGL